MKNEQDTKLIKALKEKHVLEQNVKIYSKKFKKEWGFWKGLKK